jgi:hypothetical protein
MKIQLLYFAGCPNLIAAREALRRAIIGRSDIAVDEIDTSAPSAPVQLRQWGSPTLLVDGIDIAGGAPEGPSCRLYIDGASLRGAPSDEQIRAAIIRASRRSGTTASVV